MKRAKGDKESKKQATQTIRTLLSIVSVMTMFGLSWLFGALSVSQAAIVFQWLFVLFSTTQGLVLFIFFCVIGTDAREEWKKLLSCYRYQGAKTSTTTPSSSGVHRPRKSYGTRDTSLTSKVGNSNTIRRSVGLLPEGEKSDLDSSVAPLEMSELTPSKGKYMDSIVEEDTSLLISNRLADFSQEEKTAVTDSQLPPQVLFRLRRPCYDLIIEQRESSVPSISPDYPSLQLTEMDIFNEFEPTSLHDSEVDSNGEDNELTEL